MQAMILVQPELLQEQLVVVRCKSEEMQALQTPRLSCAGESCVLKLKSVALFFI